MERAWGRGATRPGLRAPVRARARRGEAEDQGVRRHPEARKHGPHGRRSETGRREAGTPDQAGVARRAGAVVGPRCPRPVDIPIHHPPSPPCDAAGPLFALVRRGPRPVVEPAADADLPPTVVRVLRGDLAEAGLMRIDEPRRATSPRRARQPIPNCSESHSPRGTVTTRNESPPGPWCAQRTAHWRATASSCPAEPGDRTV
ncbi:DUF742 domain-containing protein [Streptomyces sp. NPDC020298]|uniref:DUF742 domain-containing protein n=1 Tax=unclassified Streptomyces TaxID=2593676 RepID=UPI0033DE4B75